MKQPVFFVVILLLLLQNTVFRVREWQVDNVIRYFSIAVLYSYLLTWLVWRSRSVMLKRTFYALMFAISLVYVQRRDVLDSAYACPPRIVNDSMEKRI